MSDTEQQLQQQSPKSIQAGWHSPLERSQSSPELTIVEMQPSPQTIDDALDRILSVGQADAAAMPQPTTG